MLKNSRTMVSLVAAGALLAVPSVGQATDHPNKGKGHAKSCATAHNMPFIVSGTVASFVVDDATTPLVNEASITMTVKNANSHAAKSGDLTDMNATKKGVQVKGGTYVIGSADAFTLKLNGYEGTDTMSVGDRVMVKGKTPLTAKRCAPAGTSTADRYGKTDITKVTISDRDADA